MCVDKMSATRDIMVQYHQERFTVYCLLLTNYLQSLEQEGLNGITHVNY